MSMLRKKARPAASIRRAKKTRALARVRIVPRFRNH